MSSPGCPELFAGQPVRATYAHRLETCDAVSSWAMDAWLVLVVRLPAQPSSQRVRAWRRLKTLGAVALKNSVWVLPHSAESYEQLQWLDQEIQRDGGEATLLKVDRIENLAEDAVIRLFNDARDRDWHRLAQGYRAPPLPLDPPAGRGAPRAAGETPARR